MTISRLYGVALCVALSSSPLLTYANLQAEAMGATGSSCGGTLEATCTVTVNQTRADELTPCFGVPVKVKQVSPTVKQAVYDARSVLFKQPSATGFEAQKYNLFMSPKQMALLAELTRGDDGIERLTNMVVVDLDAVK